MTAATLEVGTATYGVPHHRRPEVDTRALVDAAQAGDRAAFGTLYEHYRETVYRFVLRRVTDRQVAEDLTQDTFLRALRALGQYTWQGKDVGAWLVTIARNLVADYFKGAAHRTTVVADLTDKDGGTWWPTDTDRRGDPAHVAEVNDLAASLGALLTTGGRRGERLTEAERQILALRFGADLTVEETAEFLGIHVGAVKACQYRAIVKLRRILQVAPQ